MNTILQTKRLLLRQFHTGDEQAYLKCYGDPDVMKFIGDGTWLGSEETISETIRNYQSTYTCHPGCGYWAIIEKQSKELIGDAGIVPIEQTNEYEIGYLLRKDKWGNGYAQELLKALIDYGFNQLRLEEVICVAAPENLASIQVMKKCGMECTHTNAFYHNRVSVRYALKRSN